MNELAVFRDRLSAAQDISEIRGLYDRLTQLAKVTGAAGNIDLLDEVVAFRVAVTVAGGKILLGVDGGGRKFEEMLIERAKMEPTQIEGVIFRARNVARRHAGAPLLSKRWCRDRPDYAAFTIVTEFCEVDGGVLERHAVGISKKSFGRLVASGLTEAEASQRLAQEVLEQVLGIDAGEQQFALKAEQALG